MVVVKSIAELRARLDQLRCPGGSPKARTVGFVPTLGFLHEGHISLMRQAKAQCEIAVLSIFVNPLQFGANEDFSVYPRDAEHDLQIARSNGVDLVFMPEQAEMYPDGHRTSVTVSKLTDKMCGASRPGHFEGVAVVVTKLFHIVQPDFAFFGMKDAQQLAVIEQLTADLNFRIEIVRCPTVREQDGLAKSSRNVYLSPEQRAQAPILYQALKQAERSFRQSAPTAPIGATLERIRRQIAACIQTAPQAVIDYVEIWTYPALEPVTEQSIREQDLIIALAVKFGNTRLIDNIILAKEEGFSCLER